MSRSTSHVTEFDWDFIRDQFNLRRDYIHIGSSQFISSHPRHIKDTIEKYRELLDEDPVAFIEENEKKIPMTIRKKIAAYMGMDNPNYIALTDSATMGHGIIYTGFNLQNEQEILSPEHNHYSQQESIQRAATRTGTKFREVPIYENLANVTEDELVNNLKKEIHEKTKAIGLTWVNSDTGLKFPVAKMAKEIREINKNRDEKDHILLIVDGVHGFGIETETFPELGCDFFITSTHKWIYGPRGTGFVAGTEKAFQHVSPVIPSYRIMNKVSKKQEHPDKIDGKQMSPGGFHSLEHRWALAEAFTFIENIGKKRVYERVHSLARQCKEGLASMPHVVLHTPIDDGLSSGIIAFEVEGMSTQEVVDKLDTKKIIATVAPYRSEFARLTPGIINTPAEIDTVLEAIMSLKRG
ncbi:aminotransferase class V-fold PLP-dependent enzyme [Mesobacillus foraminis]|uniref:aminotransferase class V-fold PLP-dependent enzyme n=1 Tax=Mesobacillus foraminis TaxID=279826 RepID=UPI001BE789DA|nr:aminotransferase class V-fold PLP-dependent enzyme [Mesobacillus foraminis]MBT2759222.1 aminotransferase class V-fold PLP-dependent enzyme [Mesobacillus foraminis]